MQAAWALPARPKSTRRRAPLAGPICGRRSWRPRDRGRLRPRLDRAPERAADAAIVPVKIMLAEGLRGTVSRIYFVIDDNPSPLAGRFTFGTLADPREIATRSGSTTTPISRRAETKDGKLYGTRPASSRRPAVLGAGRKRSGIGAAAPRRDENDVERPVAYRLAGRGASARQPSEQLGMQMDQVTRDTSRPISCHTIKVTIWRPGGDGRIRHLDQRRIRA